LTIGNLPLWHYRPAVPDEEPKPQAPEADPPADPFKSKGFVPEFRDGSEVPVEPTVFGDRRFGQSRRQIALLAVVALGALAGLVALYWFGRPPPPETEMAAATPAPPPTPPPTPSPEERRRQEIATLRDHLRTAVDGRDWASIPPRARALLDREPDDGEAWHALGWVQEKNGDAAAAVESYGRAIAGHFLPPNSRLKRAAMLRQLGRHDEAIADLEEAMRLDGESAIVPNLLLITQLQAGQVEAVRARLATYENIGLTANADRYLLAKAALALRDGDSAAAARTLSEYQALVPPALFTALLQDRFFDPYRSDPAMVRFLVGP
jgi:tetratricopeptide (TPR) repeat protein